MNFQIRPGEIDTNGHVNNIRFVEWALDTLPIDFSEKHSVTKVLVDYRKELTYGEPVTATADISQHGDNPVTRHRITAAKKDASLLTFKWK